MYKDLTKEGIIEKPFYVDGSQVSWDRVPGGLMGAIEASDLNLRPGFSWGRFERVTAGVALVRQGITLRVPGQPDEIFLLDRAERDQEGDVLYWALQKEGDPKKRLKIFND